MALELAQLTWLPGSATPSSAELPAGEAREAQDTDRAISERVRASGEESPRRELWGSAELPGDHILSLLHPPMTRVPLPLCSLSPAKLPGQPWMIKPQNVNALKWHTTSPRGIFRAGGQFWGETQNPWPVLAVG